MEGGKFFRDFLPDVLRSGRYLAAPTPYVAGRGLANIQTGLEVSQKGVSAQKIVIVL
jgi:hypothetical protein